MDQDEFRLFSTKIVMDVEADDEEDLTAKRLSFSNADVAALEQASIVEAMPGAVATVLSQLPASPAPAVGAYAPKSHPTAALRPSPMPLSSSTRAAPSSPVPSSTSASKRVTRNSVLLRPADEPVALHVSPRRPLLHHAAPLPSSHQAAASVALHAAPIETVPVVMENSRNPMWLTWLSGFVVLFLAGSSLWSPPKTVDQTPLGDAAPQHVDEPRLPFKNYSIPRFTINASANVSGDASRVAEAAAAIEMPPVVAVDYVFLPAEDAQNLTSTAPADIAAVASQLSVHEDDEESDEASAALTTCDLDWQRFSRSVPSLTISMGDNGFLRDDVAVAVAEVVEEQRVEEVAAFAVEAVEEQSPAAAVDVPAAVEAPVSTAVAVDSAPLTELPPAGGEAAVVDAEEAAAVDGEAAAAEAAVPVVTIDNAVDVLDVVEADDAVATDASVVPAASAPVLFPADMNIAESNTGARVVARESTKRCVKATKWNPLQCHRPLKTVNSHLPIASPLDCFAFYLEPDAARRSPKNSVTVELFRPAKAVYGFGLSHFLADAGHEDARFNASCAPRDISFTVFENIPASTETRQFRFPFTWTSIKQQIQRDADSVTAAPTATATATPRFLPSVEIPTTFDGIVFDPRGSHVAQAMQSPPASRGTTVTAFFPLSTTLLPQYVHKVRMHVHSTQSGGDMACVYRLQVYGDFGTPPVDA